MDTHAYIKAQQMHKQFEKVISIYRFAHITYLKMCMYSFYIWSDLPHLTVQPEAEMLSLSEQTICINQAAQQIKNWCFYVLEVIILFLFFNSLFVKPHIYSYSR